MDVESYLLGKKAGGGTPAVLQDKEITITTNGETNITADEGYTGLSKVELTTNVQPDLESKSVTISTNTTTTITPTSGKDGLSSVEVTTNVPQPSGKITITQNGTDIDVSSYASADVSVPVGGKYAPKWVKFGGSNTNFAYQGTDLVYETSNLDTSNITDMTSMFANCLNLTSVDVDDWDTSNVIDMGNMFSNCNNLSTSLDLSGWDTSKTVNFTNMFNGCSSLTSLNLSGWDTSKAAGNNGYISNMFNGCSSLTSLDLSSFITTSTKSVSHMFDGCTNLTHIDIRNMTFGNVYQSYNYEYMFGSSASTGVPDNCEIIVKSDSQKTWITSKWSRLTNVKTVAEYEGN